MYKGKGIGHERARMETPVHRVHEGGRMWMWMSSSVLGDST